MLMLFTQGVMVARLKCIHSTEHCCDRLIGANCIFHAMAWQQDLPAAGVDSQYHSAARDVWT